VGDQTLKLTMVKSITSGGTYSALNNVINYSYQLTNAGNVTLSGTGGSGQFTVTDNKTTVTCPVATKTLAPNATVTCTAAYTINQTDLDNGSVTNIATGHSKFSATAVDSNSDTQTATGTQSPALQLTKTIASGNHFTAAGQVVHYNYQLKNTGNVTLTSPFAVSDNKTTVDCSGSPSSLAPQSTYTCTSSYTVLQSDLDTGSVVNLAQATGNFKTTVITSNTDTQTALGVQTEKLTFVKTITSGATYDAVGDVIEYSYLLKNDGNVTLKGTGSAGEFTITDDQTSVTCPATPTSLAPAETVTCTAAYTINQTDLDNGSVTNVATGHSAFGTIPVDSNEDTQTATGTQNPALQLTKSIASGDHFTSAGQIIHYSYLVENIGNVTLAAPFAVSDNKTTVDCSSAPASLAPLGTFTCVSSYTVLQSDLDDGSVVNVAHATGNFKTETITSNEDTQTATGDQTKQLTLVKTLVSGDNYTTVGDILTYSYLLTNSGNVTLTGAGASGEFTVSDDKTSVTCPIATTSLLPNASVTCAATYTVTQDDLDAGKVINVATGHGKFKTESVDSNEDSQQANAVQSPSLTIVKEVSASSSGPWDPDSITVSLAAPVYYRITVKNTGNITLTSVSLDDDTCTVSSPSGDSDGDEKLDVDETWVYTCSVTAEAGTHVNTATVTTDQTSPAADTAGYFAQQPIIGYSKQVSSVQKISAGTYDVTYTILVKNFGNVSLSNLTLTDDMAATFPVPTSYVIRSLTSPQLTVNTGYNGSSDKSLLASGNSLAVGAADSITLVVRVVPTWVGPYNNSISGSGTSSLNVTVTDISQNGDNPDPDDDGNPDNNNTPTPVNFGPTIFEPPMGVKTLDRTQMPVMKWNMIWVNNKNIVPVANTMHDPIPAYTSYIADFTDSGIGVPAGAPTGSTSKGVTCTVSGKSTTSLCYYEGPTASNPRGQIIWQGILAPDYGVTDPTLALNSVNITFSVKFLENATTVKNVATIDTDLNGDGDTNDAGEQQVASASAEWNAQPVALPSTGFAPGVLTTLPEQPKALAYDTLGDMWIEIPGLGLKSTIIGVPQSTDSWNISWLGEDIGWLNGTAFPTHAGNAVLTGHVYNADGQPGPFVDLSQMKYGDEIIIHAWNQSYVYQVRETKTITATNSQAVLEHEDLPWITLLTCRDSDAKSGNYLNRYLVRAVLVKIQ
jgi:LPXTG-site transpeptidase (sortase) family protein